MVNFWGQPVLSSILRREALRLSRKHKVLSPGCLGGPFRIQHVAWTLCMLPWLPPTATVWWVVCTVRTRTLRTFLVDRVKGPRYTTMYERTYWICALFLLKGSSQSISANSSVSFGVAVGRARRDSRPDERGGHDAVAVVCSRFTKAMHRSMYLGGLLANDGIF